MSEVKPILYDSDPNSILVMNIEGKIRRLYCPFRVVCMSALEGIPANTWVYVGLVTSSKTYSIIYHINGNAYPYYHFRIYIKF